MDGLRRIRGIRPKLRGNQEGLSFTQTKDAAFCRPHSFIGDVIDSGDGSAPHDFYEIENCAYTVSPIRKNLPLFLLKSTVLMQNDFLSAKFARRKEVLYDPFLTFSYRSCLDMIKLSILEMYPGHRLSLFSTLYHN